MNDQEQFEQQLREKATGNGQPPAPDALDVESSEMELRGRIATLEEWRERAEPALRLLCIALIALVVSVLLSTWALRKRLP